MSTSLGRQPVPLPAQLTDSRAQRTEQLPRPSRARCPLRTRPGHAALALERRLRGGGSERRRHPPVPGATAPPAPSPATASRAERPAPKRKWKGRHARAARQSGAQRGRAAAAPPFPRKPRRGQSSPHKGGSQAAGKFSAAAGEMARVRAAGRPGPATNKSGNFCAQPTARLSRTPRRRLPAPRLSATARRGTAAPGRGWLGAGLSAQGSAPGGEGRAASHLRSAEGAGAEHVPGAGGPGHACRAGAPGAGGGRAAPAATTLHAAGAGGRLGRGRQAPPAGRLHSGNKAPLAFPSRRHHVTSSGGGGKGATPPRIGLAHPTGRRQSREGEVVVLRRG